MIPQGSTVSTVAMGRRHDTADELLARAEANGYKRGAHKVADEDSWPGETRQEDEEGSRSNTLTLRPVRAEISLNPPLERRLGTNIIPQMASWNHEGRL